MKVEIVKGRIIQPYDKTTLSGKFELSPVTKKRSTGQNAYLHYILFKQLAEGMERKLKKPITMEFAKEIVKYKYLQQFTEAGTVVLPTSKLDTKQCMEFIEKCQQYASEMLNISIPSPNETDYSIIEETE